MKHRTEWSFQDIGGKDASKKPRCRACGGETVNVLVRYGASKPQYEWECMICGKAFKPFAGSEDKRKYRKNPKRKFRKESYASSPRRH